VGRPFVSVYRERGIAEAVAWYRAVRDTAAARWNVDAGELNSVGYWLLSRGAVDDAVAVFRLNVEEYPREPNPHDSLGDGYLAQGRTAEAVESIRRAVELAQAADDPGLAGYRAHLEAAQRRATPP
jgi:Flp pilus assembly protein TadD